MLTEHYIEALIADALLADGVFDLWEAGIIDNRAASEYYLRIATQL